LKRISFFISKPPVVKDLSRVVLVVETAEAWLALDAEAVEHVGDEVVLAHDARQSYIAYKVTDYVYCVTIHNMQEKSFDQDAARRRLILDAARDCFLKFGYAKTSFEDIAKQAVISR
jgi:hypothetical protein